jgi:hypothetical protein
MKGSDGGLNNATGRLKLCPAVEGEKEARHWRGILGGDAVFQRHEAALINLNDTTRRASPGERASGLPHSLLGKSPDHKRQESDAAVILP